MFQVRFNSLVEFFDFIPDEEKRITLTLRDLIFEAIPEIKEKLSYQVPFYKLKRNICFIWPSSVVWGNKKSYKGVKMGFNYGSVLIDKFAMLDLSDRKQIAYLHFHSLEEVEKHHELIRNLLLESKKIDSLKNGKKY